MFNLATPLTNGMINKTLQQFTPLSDISKGSVATHLRCVAIYSDDIIANCLLILTVKKKLKNRLIFDKVMTYKNCAIFGPPCIYRTYAGIMMGA